MVPMPLKEAHVDVVSVLRERAHAVPAVAAFCEAILGPLTQDYLGPVRLRGTVFLNVRPSDHQGQRLKQKKHLTDGRSLDILQIICFSKKCIQARALIKSGGGTGPMKPGNRQPFWLCHGANSCRNEFLGDERGSARRLSICLSLSRERHFA